MKKSFQIFFPPPPSLQLHCFPEDEVGAQGKCTCHLHASVSLSYQISTDKKNNKKTHVDPCDFCTFFPAVWSSSLHGCRLCSLCIWLHKHNQYGRGELFYDWRSCCVFGGEIHYLVSEPSAIQYHLFIKSLFARRKWIQLQQPRERGRGGETREREEKKGNDQERWRERTCVYGGVREGGVGWIDHIDQGSSWNKGFMFFFKHFWLTDKETRWLRGGVGLEHHIVAPSD